MTILVTLQAQLIVGEEQVIKSWQGMLAAVFEDDGRTGYFYALDESLEGNPILDAVHIYNVEDISDAHIPSDVKIGWSEDCQKCVLLINGYPHAAFDFVGKNGYTEADTHPRLTRFGLCPAMNGAIRWMTFPVSYSGLNACRFSLSKVKMSP
jgi:hypothetical protein